MTTKKGRQGVWANFWKKKQKTYLWKEEREVSQRACGVKNGFLFFFNEERFRDVHKECSERSWASYFIPKHWFFHLGNTGEVSMKITIKIRPTVTACALQSPFKHVNYCNSHHLVTIQMSKPWSQLFRLCLLPCMTELWGRDELLSRLGQDTQGRG